LIFRETPLKGGEGLKKDLGGVDIHERVLSEIKTRNGKRRKRESFIREGGPNHKAIKRRRKREGKGRVSTVRKSYLFL